MRASNIAAIGKESSAKNRLDFTCTEDASFALECFGLSIELPVLNVFNTIRDKFARVFGVECDTKNLRKGEGDLTNK